MFVYFSTELYDLTNIEWMPELQLNLENIHLTNLQPGRANIMVSNTAIGPRRNKTCLRGFRQCEFQTGLLSYTD